MSKMLVLSFIAGSIFSFSVMADSFKGEATYRKAAPRSIDRVTFNALEMQGIKFEALQDAMKQCRHAGKQECVFVNSTIQKGCDTNPYLIKKCSASAKVISLD